MEDLLANLCYCLFERNALTGGPPATLLEWLTSGHSQAQAVLWMLSYYEHGEMVAILGQMGHSYSDMESAESFLSTASLKEFEDKLVTYGYDDCYKLKNALYSLLQNDASKLIDLLSLHPDLKEMVAGTEFSSNCTSISSSELINSLVAYDRRALWDVLFDAVNVSEMIAYFKLSESTMFHYTVANQHPQWYGIYQNSHNLYSTTGTGMESYFGRIKDQFGQLFYDNLIAKFLNASKTYIDSFRLTEQVIMEVHVLAFTSIISHWLADILMLINHNQA
ncbi:MAG: hypothetical protein Q8R57_14455 [Bacteroidota bacterium]|nr:hypothetical protein [Bacteroidota bacterium]